MGKARSTVRGNRSIFVDSIDQCGNPDQTYVARVTLVQIVPQPFSCGVVRNMVVLAFREENELLGVASEEGVEPRGFASLRLQLPSLPHLHLDASTRVSSERSDNFPSHHCLSLTKWTRPPLLWSPNTLT